MKFTITKTIVINKNPIYKKTKSVLYEKWNMKLTDLNLAIENKVFPFAEAIK